MSYTPEQLAEWQQQGEKIKELVLKARAALGKDEDEAQNCGMEAHPRLLVISEDISKALGKDTWAAHPDLDMLRILVHKCARILKYEIFNFGAYDVEAQGALPEFTDAVPIRLFKRAKIQVEKDDAWFKGVTGTAYRTTARAECPNVEDDPQAITNPWIDIYPELNIENFVYGHTSAEIPHLGCSCGFYALDPERWEKEGRRAGGCATLEVEFYGKVIEFTEGYRGEYQRVLSCTLDKLDFEESSPLGLFFLKGRTVADLANLLKTEVRIAQ